MLLDKMDQGVIKREIANMIVDGGEGLLADDGIDETVAGELADTILEKVMSLINTMGYFVLDGVVADIAKYYGIMPTEVPPEFLQDIHQDIRNNLEGVIGTAVGEALKIYPQGKFANMLNCTTTSRFWDCECAEGYIHPKSDETCKKCGCYQGDMPDSMLREVVRQGLL
jgi:hypothetical protein